MGEDQHAARARGLDEAERGDRLAGAGRVLEPEAPVGAGIVGQPLRRDVGVELAVVLPILRLLLVGVDVVEVVVEIVDRRRASPACRDLWPTAAPLPVPLVSVAPRRRSTGSPPLPLTRRRPAGFGEQRRQRSRERVDLVCGEHGAVDETGLVLGQQPLEPEQQRELATPLQRGLRASGLDLGQRAVERATARRAGGERRLRRSRPRSTNCSRVRYFSASDRGRAGKWGGITHGLKRCSLNVEPPATCLVRLRRVSAQ